MIECAPATSVDVGNLATPALSVPVPSDDANLRDDEEPMEEPPLDFSIAPEEETARAEEPAAHAKPPIDKD